MCVCVIKKLAERQQRPDSDAAVSPVSTHTHTHTHSDTTWLLDYLKSYVKSRGKPSSILSIRN